MRLEFVVYGKARSGGSKRTFRHPVTGRNIVTEQVDNRQWREAVSEAGARAFAGVFDAGLLDGPLRVRMEFIKPRPKGHYGTGRNAGILKASAPAYPTTRPDALKLARLVEDALTGQVWRDDAQIVAEHLYKSWGEPERCEIVIETLAATMMLELAA